jgi:RHS repeat-associated protein
VRDLRGNVVAKTLPGGETTSFTRDAAGRVTRAAAPGVELSRTHDALGNLLTETINGRTLTLGYDPAGRLSRRTTPTGRTSTWTHTATGAPATLTTAGRTLTFDHDPLGRETARNLGELTLTHAWDAVGRLAAQTAATAAHRVHHRTWTYRADDYPTAVTDPTGTTHYTLDPLGRITNVAAPDHTEHYGYDSLGNQTAAHYPTADPEPAGPRAYTSTLLIKAGRLRYDHDRAGRVITRRASRLSKKPATWRYTWDAEDHLTSCTTPDGTTWRYRYDPLGRRIAKQRLSPDGHSVAEEILFTWQGTTLVEQTTTTDGTTLTWDHHGLTPLTQTEHSPQSEFDDRFYAIITDLVGTPTHLVDEAGHTAWHTTATLWGVSSAPAQTPLRFPGQYADPETGWHYNYHRHYDPTVARYASPDPLGLAPSPNPHSYVRNPQVWIDPLGLSGYPVRPTGEAFPNRPLPRNNGHPVPDVVGAPHTQLGRRPGRRGSYPQAREFDADGNPVRDIDFTDHGRPQNHENPHQHNYIPNPTGGTPQRGPAVPLEWPS